MDDDAFHGPCADSALGEALLNALPLVALAGFAAELSSCRFLCGETFRVRERGAGAEVLATSLERQSGARAARAARRETAALIVAGDADGESRGAVAVVGRTTQLIRAAAGGDAARVRALVALGAPRDLVDGDGRSALHWAALNGHEEVVDALLAGPGVGGGGSGAGGGAGGTGRGGGAADDDLVDLRGADGSTALMLAARGGHERAARRLLAGGASADLLSRDGCSALAWACLFGRAGAAALLLAHGANADLPSGRGETPLMLACARGDAGTAAALLDAGANAGARNRDGLTALRLAVAGRQAAVADLLRDRGVAV